MRSLSNASGAAALTILESLIAKKTLTAVDAWRVFSYPMNPVKLQKDQAAVKLFNDAQSDALIALKEALRNTLDDRSDRRCVYCKRAKGNHGFSWHVEHILGKTRNPLLIFDLSNLAAACGDCNMIKNNSVDQSRTAYDIINPNAKNFDYSSHLSFFQMSTEKLHVLRYKTHSNEGRATYKKLKFSVLERVEALESLDSEIFRMNQKIRNAIEYYVNLERDPKAEIANFLDRLKTEMFSK